MTATAAPVLPMLVDEVAVVAVRRLSTSFVRVELGGPALVDLADGPFFDQRIKLIFPSESGRLPDLRAAGSSWWETWLALPEAERGHLRTYSIRAVRGAGPHIRLVVDFVLHLADGATGPASAWASRARVGDRLVLVAPHRGTAFGGIEFAPGVADRLLLVGDETAVPAVSSILEDLPVDAVGKAYLEVPTPDDVQNLRGPAGVRVVWLPRHDAPHGERLCRAVLALFGLDDGDDTDVAVDPDLWETPTYSSSGEAVDATDGTGATGGGLYAWVAGEAGTVARLRRHLVRDAGLDRRQVAFMGYWRIGVSMR